MKRILCFVLVLCTLLSVFPVAVSLAEEEKTLPVDVSDTTDTLGEGERAPLTDYDALYVGGDGKKTANGGKLVGLYTAYAGDASVDLTNGVWQNKVDATGDTDAVIQGDQFFCYGNLPASAESRGDLPLYR